MEISIVETKVPFTSRPIGRALKTLGAGILGVVLLSLLGWASEASNFQPLIDLIDSPFYRSLATISVASLASWAGRKVKESGGDLKVI